MSCLIQTGNDQFKWIATEQLCKKKGSFMQSGLIYYDMHRMWHFSFVFTSEASNRPRKNKKINIIPFMYVDTLTYEKDFFTCMHRIQALPDFDIWMTK